MRKVVEGCTAVLVKLFDQTTGYVFAPVPQAAALLPTPSARVYFAVPFGTLCIVAAQVCSWDSKENVVIDPLCQGAHAMPSKKICSGISQHTISATSRREAEVVTDVDRELVFRL